MNEHVYETEWLGRTLTVKSGKLAKQADAAVTVQYGDTVVLATVVESKEAREGIDFFPLMVDFEERLYAAGIIKGSRWIKREGRPSDEAVLTGRMIDRSIRPLFISDSRKDVQVTLTVLSADQVNDFDIIALVAASAVLSISGLNWQGPIGGVRIGLIDGNFVFNPTYEERAASSLDLIVAGTAERVLMIEAGAMEIPEETMLDAILKGQEQIAPIIAFLEKIKAEISKPAKSEDKATETSVDEAKEKSLKLAEEWLNANIKKILFDKVYYTKGERKAAVAAIKEQLKAYLSAEGLAETAGYAVKKLVEPMVEAEVTRAILEEKKRVDGRALDEIRALSAETGILPRNHGCGLFSRGETQVMSIVTLGAPGLVQSLEGIEGVGTKRYMHHYNFPPYSTAEAKPMRSPGRREIGHGALAEKALIPVIPEKEDFPYTIRVVSEVLSSNGSSSMGSTCGSSLALMDAGVPIKKAVAGMAMGLASNQDMSRWEVLTDLQDLEDGQGGMDFKITGTADGITAIQLDTKTIGLDKAIIEKTLVQGKKARLEILDVMNKEIDKARPDLSPYAPRIYTLRIDPENIRDVIGTGGKVINEIIAVTGVSIDIEDDGMVLVCGTDSAKADEAIAWIKNIVRKFTPGEEAMGKVVRMLDFGAFIELSPSKDGMAHVSELAPYRVGKPEDLLKLGDVVKVKVIEVDDQGRINLTMKGFPENAKYWEGERGKMSGDFAAGRSNGFGNSRGRSNGFGDRRSSGPRR